MGELAQADVGTLAWLERSEGRLSKAERGYLLRGVFPMIRDGFRLRRFAKRSPRRAGALDPFEPPVTPIVVAAQQYLERHASAPMRQHSYRTAFWTLVVLDMHRGGDVDAKMLETTWVAALLHDVGLDEPPERGDFSTGGVQILQRLAQDFGWSEEQTHQASEAIAVNLSTRVDAAKVGQIAWAMNVGGAGELGIWPHRAQLDRVRLRALEARFPRDGFREQAMDLIRREAKRLPDGRFALFKSLYWLLMR